MRFLRKNAPKTRPDPALPAPNVPADWAAAGAWRAWEAPLSIVRGEARCQSALKAIAGPIQRNGWLVPVEATLVREPTNPVDENAIVVQVQGQQVGYLGAEFAAELSPSLDARGVSSFRCAALIRGGSAGAPSLGVHLWPKHRTAPGPDIDFPDGLGSRWPPRQHEGDPDPEPRPRVDRRPAPVSGELTGMTVCFTGTFQRLVDGEPISRFAVQERSAAAGLIPVPSVTKQTQVLVVADEDTMSNKAEKARKYGIRILTEDEFWAYVDTA